MKTKQAQPPFVNFSVAREYLGRNGLWNPRDGNPPLKAAFQINVFGAREHYLQLAEFFREFAERDTSTDGDYHDHFEGISSNNGLVRLHVILRKDDVGDSSWKDQFPKRKKTSRRTKNKKAE